MYYTSGTTGRPKGVVLSHKNVVLHALGCMVEHRIHSDDVWAHIAPMFHLVDAYGMFAVAWVGGRHVFLADFSPASALRLIELQRVTVTNMASTMINMLLTDPSRPSRDLSSLQLLSGGGAPINQDTMKRALGAFGCEFFLSYGMTECCGKISMSLLQTAKDEDPQTGHMNSEIRRLSQQEQLAYVCTSGRPFSLLEVRVVPAAVVSVPWDGKTVGEVQIRGETVFRGYWRRPAATRKSFVDDSNGEKKGGGLAWFKTGDLAFVEPRGYLTICDRAKDMILTGSENVYSVEVERVLQDHRGVRHACVFGEPNELLGEIVKAVVVRYDGPLGTPVSAAELRRHCVARLADYKVPRRIEFVDALPMTGSVFLRGE
eukprot:jgi/Bigna1/36846/e_gw1.16.19.1